MSLPRAPLTGESVHAPGQRQAGRQAGRVHVGVAPLRSLIDRSRSVRMAPFNEAPLNDSPFLRAPQPADEVVFTAFSVNYDRPRSA